MHVSSAEVFIHADAPISLSLSSYHYLHLHLRPSFTFIAFSACTMLSPLTFSPMSLTAQWTDSPLLPTTAVFNLPIAFDLPSPFPDAGRPDSDSPSIDHIYYPVLPLDSEGVYRSPKAAFQKQVVRTSYPHSLSSRTLISSPSPVPRSRLRIRRTRGGSTLASVSGSVSPVPPSTRASFSGHTFKAGGPSSSARQRLSSRTRRERLRLHLRFRLPRLTHPPGRSGMR
ncbi:hypothetical protein B0H19DRAFT_140821 [Mycena capillaripes]|nr:hypothetical protein B0H19DRAFT_140821 [Mycena capillaripes]